MRVAKRSGRLWDSVGRKAVRRGVALLEGKIPTGSVQLLCCYQTPIGTGETSAGEGEEGKGSQKLLLYSRRENDEGEENSQEDL